MSKNENEKLRYSDADLAYFKDLLNAKINEAKEQSELIKSAYMNNASN